MNENVQIRMMSELIHASLVQAECTHIVNTPMQVHHLNNASLKLTLDQVFVGYWCNRFLTTPHFKTNMPMGVQIC